SAQVARLALTEAWVRGPGAGAVWMAAAVKGRISAAAGTGSGGSASQVPADQGTEEGGGGAEDDPGGELIPGDGPPGGGAVHARPPPPPPRFGPPLPLPPCRMVLRPPWEPPPPLPRR